VNSATVRLATDWLEVISPGPVSGVDEQAEALKQSRPASAAFAMGRLGMLFIDLRSLARATATP
jgi:hypothetical protein